MKKILLAILLIAPMAVMAQGKFAHFNLSEIHGDKKQRLFALTGLASSRRL